MLIELDRKIPKAVIDSLLGRLAFHPDITVWPLSLRGRRFLVVSGDEALMPPLVPGVDRGIVAVHHTAASGYFLVARESNIAPAQVAIGDTEIGHGRRLWCAAGPCALESVDDTVQTGRRLRAGGAHALRVSLFKTRSSPYYFQGKGRAALADLAYIREATGLPVVTEVTDPRDVAAVAEVASCLHVDARNMSNHALLGELGIAGQPVLLMRGPCASIAEWLRAAEYIVTRGNTRIVLCARGVVGLDESAAYAPDFCAIQVIRKHTDLPIVYDPSHSTGHLPAVAPAALAACAFGADGLLIESCLHADRMYRPGDAAHMYPPGKLSALLAACETASELGMQLTANDRADAVV